MNTQRLPYASLSADLLQGLRQTKTALESSSLDLALIELIYLRVSKLTGAAIVLDCTQAPCAKEVKTSNTLTHWQAGMPAHFFRCGNALRCSGQKH